MIEFPIEQSTAFLSQIQGVGGVSFKLSLKYNSTDTLWRLGLYTIEGQPILEGVPLVEGQSPTAKYALEGFPTGDFWCFAKKKVDTPLGFDNLGFNKDYGLFFLTHKERGDYGI